MIYMNIDLSKLHNGVVEEIDITNTYSIPQEYIKDDSVIEANNLDVKGKIFLKDNDGDNYLDDYIDCSIKGIIKYKDSISLEPIDLDINIEYSDFIEENYKKNENILDIFASLWENVELEVPLQFTKVRDLSKFHGDGWKLISEDDLNKSNNPFSELLKDFDNKE